MPVTLKCLKPKELQNPPQTIGEHLKARRLALQLYQRDAAKLLNITPETLLHWEKGQTEPPVSAYPAIRQFLEYDPCPEAQTLAQKLIQKRRERGWTIKAAALAVGVDPTTWGDWEAGDTILFQRHRQIIAQLLEVEESEVSDPMRIQWVAAHKKPA